MENDKENLTKDMQKAIVHAETGVIRRLTTDEEPSLAKDEAIIEVKKDLDLAGGYFKADEKGKVTRASEEEVDAADVDDEKVSVKRKAKYENITNIITDLAENGVTLEKLQLYFQAIK